MTSKSQREITYLRSWQQWSADPAFSHAIEQFIFRTVGLGDDAIVLEAGSGPGAITRYLASWCGRGRVHSVDRDALSIAKLNVNRRAWPFSNITTAVTDLCRSELGTEEYDFSYLRFVLQHVADPDAALARIVKALKPGGKLCVVDVDVAAVSHYPPDRELDELLAQLERQQIEAGGDPRIAASIPFRLRQAGLVGVSTEVMLFDETVMPVADCIDLFVEPRIGLFVPESERDAARARLRAGASRARDLAASMRVPVFIAWGEKPSKGNV